MENNKIKIMLHWIVNFDITEKEIIINKVDNDYIKDFLEVFNNQRSNKRKIVKNRILENFNACKGELIPCFLNINTLNIEIIF